MSDQKQSYTVLIPTIVGGKHLPAGSVVELTEKQADGMGGKFIKLVKVAAPAETQGEAADLPSETAAKTVPAKTK